MTGLEVTSTAWFDAVDAHMVAERERALAEGGPPFPLWSSAPATLVIGARCVEVHETRLEPGQTVRWAFTLEAYDIGFRASFIVAPSAAAAAAAAAAAGGAVGAEEEAELLEAQGRLQVGLGPQRGEYGPASCQGLLRLEFDNMHAMMRSKKVRLRCVAHAIVP
eukprot:COSAG01_NODE_13053_length_1644_cov_1.129450_1_plen_163_part_10